MFGMRWGCRRKTDLQARTGLVKPQERIQGVSKGMGVTIDEEGLRSLGNSVRYKHE